ncbi:hypothetical protein E0Z10_g1317 [Xylaria hypoxylon]|uniref:Uncharacterized protein n=1 Tax=Xylaria hypoxylon TaxID=37992 RepID=A0A4Z0Z7H8_9PEZI|nr:hypothetical protein E0Z10_g1317 [Xylaria hypoxylon]
MINSSNSRPATITVDIPIHGAICSILIPEIENGSATRWHAVWSSDRPLCDRYEAAQYDACGLQVDLVTDYSFTLSDCVATNWIAPATIEIPIASIAEYCPDLGTASYLTPNIDKEHLWWLAPLPLCIAFLVGLFWACISVCRGLGNKEGGDEGEEETASEWPRPAYLASADMEVEASEK